MDGTNKTVLKLYALNIDVKPAVRSIRVQDNHRVQIGRASKNELKGLKAACDNAWVDSPVMSRNHAEIYWDGNEEQTMIKDIGSMHGTKINGEILSRDIPHWLRDGDTIELGTQVRRTGEVFEPCRFRVVLTVSENVPSSTTTYDNSIQVPYYSDDEDEYGNEDEYNSDKDEDVETEPALTSCGDSSSPASAMSKVIDLTGDLQSGKIHFPVVIDVDSEDDMDGIEVREINPGPFELDEQLDNADEIDQDSGKEEEANIKEVQAPVIITPEPAPRATFKQRLLMNLAAEKAEIESHIQQSANLKAIIMMANTKPVAQAPEPSFVTQTVSTVTESEWKQEPESGSEDEGMSDGSDVSDDETDAERSSLESEDSGAEDDLEQEDWLVDGDGIEESIPTTPPASVLPGFRSPVKTTESIEALHKSAAEGLYQLGSREQMLPSPAQGVNTVEKETHWAQSINPSILRPFVVPARQPSPSDAAMPRSQTGIDTGTSHKDHTILNAMYVNKLNVQRKADSTASEILKATPKGPRDSMFLPASQIDPETSDSVDSGDDCTQGMSLPVSPAPLSVKPGQQSEIPPAIVATRDGGDTKIGLEILCESASSPPSAPQVTASPLLSRKRKLNAILSLADEREDWSKMRPTMNVSEPQSDSASSNSVIILPEERPAKRPRQFFDALKYAAIGATVSSVAIFGALVATAPDFV